MPSFWNEGEGQKGIHQNLPSPVHLMNRKGIKRLTIYYKTRSSSPCLLFSIANLGYLLQRWSIHHCCPFFVFFFSFFLFFSFLFFYLPLFYLPLRFFWGFHGYRFCGSSALITWSNFFFGTWALTFFNVIIVLKVPNGTQLIAKYFGGPNFKDAICELKCVQILFLAIFLRLCIKYVAYIQGLGGKSARLVNLSIVHP